MLMKIKGQGRALSLSQPLATSSGKSKKTKHFKAVEKSIFIFDSVFKAAS